MKMPHELSWLQWSDPTAFSLTLLSPRNIKGSGDKFVADQNRFISNEIFNQLIL